MPIPLFSAIVTLLLTGSLSLMSQPSYLKGCIVFNNGDTSSALIHFNPGLPPLNSIDIRDSHRGNPRTFSTATVRSFWLSGYGTFSSHRVTVSLPRLNSTGTRYWNEVIDMQLYLQELVVGNRFSLYKLGNHKYYLEDNTLKSEDRIEELVFRQFDDCCTYPVYQKQLASYLPIGDSYEDIVRYADYSDRPLKKAVVYLNDTSGVKSVAKNHAVHFFGSAGFTVNRLSLTYEIPVGFLTRVAPSIGAGIFWQSSGKFEHFLNVVSFSYTQYKSGYDGWLRDKYALPSNTHFAYNFTPKLAILYRILDKFKYRFYTGLSAGYTKTIVKSNLTNRSINSEYFTARCFNADAFVFKAELLVNFGKYAVSAFEQLGNSYDIGANGYQMNSRTAGMLLSYNF